MRDLTINKRQPAAGKTYTDRAERMICNMDHCQMSTSDRVGIALCERHLEKAWAAFQVLQGADVPGITEDPDRDVTSLDARGTVYIVRVGDLIKIGWTSNPKTRMSNLGPDAILHYFAGTRRDEFRLHGQCVDHLAKGREWFTANDAMLAFVRAVRNGSNAA